MKTATSFRWECHPKAEALLLQMLSRFCTTNPFIKSLQDDLLTKTSTRLFDWVDHFVVEYSPGLEENLEENGFISENVTATYRVFHHPGAQLPRVIIQESGTPTAGVAVAVDSIADFLLVRGCQV